LGMILLGYFSFVLTKSFLGYYKHGLLAFRHAAMMYYLIFAVFGYFMFKSQKINRPVSLICLLLIILGNITMAYHRYWFFTVTAIFIALLNGYFSRREKILFLIVYFLSAPNLYFFQTSRTFLIANIVGLYVALFGLWHVIKGYKRFKVAVIMIISCLLIIFGRELISTNKITSMYMMPELLHRWQVYDAKVQEKLKSKDYDFALMNMPSVMLYNESNNAMVGLFADGTLSESAILPLKEKYVKGNRTIDVEYHNILFRAFIWRDMLQNMIARKAILGSDFGEPFLSPSLIILNWGATEWKRDGWIEPHNSFLNLIYRAGIIGVLLVSAIIFYWIRAIKIFIENKYSFGILVCAITLSWLVAAMFLPILELPYSAIPFWIFYGIMYLNYEMLDRAIP
jgi:hypothetical protein